jgi:hypothetical protein
MARPIIRDAIAAGKLKVQRARIDTDTDRLMPIDSDEPAGEEPAAHTTH